MGDGVRSDNLVSTNTNKIHRKKETVNITESFLQ